MLESGEEVPVKLAMRQVVNPLELLEIAPEARAILSLGCGKGTEGIVGEAKKRGVPVTILHRDGMRFIDDQHNLWFGSTEDAIEPSQYDIILVYNVLQYLESQFALETLLPKLIARLAPAGVIDIVVSGSRDSHPVISRYDRLDIVNVLEATGLTMLRQFVWWLVRENLGVTERTHVVWVRAKKPT